MRPTVAAASAALALAAAGCGPTLEETAELPLRDDFAGTCSWARASTDAARLGCEDGRYRIVVGQADRPVAAHRSIEAAGSLRLRTSATSLSDDERSVYGVGCWTRIDGDGYVFLVTASGKALIARVRREQPGFETLAETDEAFSAPVAPADLVEVRADCLAPEGEPGRLVLALDGRVVLTAEDPARPSSFRDVGFYVGTTAGATDVRFDEFEAEALEGESLLAALAQEEPVVEPGRPRVLLRDDFADRSQGWPDGRAEPGTFGYADGAYRIRLDQDGTIRRGLIATGRAARAVEVAAEVAAEGRPATAGIGCYATPERGYVFVAEPDGGYAILAEDVDRRFVAIARSHPDSAAPAPGTTLRASCTGEPEGSTQLELRVGPRVVVSTSVPGGLSSFRGPALFGRSATGDSEVRFDDVVVRRL